MSANDKMAATFHPLEIPPAAERLVTEYGVETPRGIVLVVTEKYDDAEAALRWIAGGRIVSRAVAYYPWKAALL